MRRTVRALGALSATALAAVSASAGATAAPRHANGPFARFAARYHGARAHATTNATRSSRQGFYVIADHLANPRQLQFARGALYIAEAGSGGSTCLAPDLCFGFTGSIDRWQNGDFDRIVTGLVSAGSADGSFTTGADAVAYLGYGRVLTQITSAGAEGVPDVPGAARARHQLGRLLRFGPSGVAGTVAKVDDYEFANDPDHEGVDSNPYGVASVSHGHQVVTDAAGNTLLDVVRGKVSLLAVFPHTASGHQSVPTSVVVGPDHAYYVGEFTGEPTVAGDARIWRVVPGQAPTVFASGLTAVTGLAFGPAGDLYASEFTTDGASPAGAVVRIGTDGQIKETLGQGSLFFAGGVAVDSHSNVYVSNWSVLPGHTDAGGPFGGANGQVVRLDAGDGY